MEVTRACANCQDKFTPRVDWQECCTSQCASALRQRRYRARHRKGGGPKGGGNGGGGGAPTLFDGLDSGLHATIGGAVDYGRDGSASDKNRYSVKPASGRRKSPTHASQARKSPKAAA